MKTARRLNKMSGSTRRLIERIVAARLDGRELPPRKPKPFSGRGAA